MTEDATQRGEPDPIWTQRAGFSVLFDCMATPIAQEVWRTRIYHDETGGDRSRRSGRPTLAEMDHGPARPPPDAGR